MNNSDTEAVAMLSTIENQIRKGQFFVRRCSLTTVNDAQNGMRLVLDFATEPADNSRTMRGVTEYVMPSRLVDVLNAAPKPQPLQPFGSRDLDID